MTATTTLHSTIPNSNVSTPQTATPVHRLCAFCPEPARTGSLYCDRCARGYWDYLRSMDPAKSLPSLEGIRAYVFARRDERRQQQLSRRQAARQQLAQIAVIPTALLLDERISRSPVALRVYGALAALGADARWVIYSRRVLAESLGYNLQTISRAMDWLITRGYVAREREEGRTLVRCRVGGQP